MNLFNRMAYRGPKLEQVTFDAAGQTLGRLSSAVAATLRGKRLVTFAPNIVPNIEVVVTNVRALRFTGTKLTTKLYHRFSGYPGGIKTSTLQQRLDKDPVRLVRNVVQHMLPKNRLQARLMRHLKVYTNEATK